MKTVNILAIELSRNGLQIVWLIGPLIHFNFWLVGVGNNYDCKAKAKEMNYEAVKVIELLKLLLDSLTDKISKTSKQTIMRL